MKAAIIGYSGSGKSTLAGILGARYGAQVLHLDRVQFLPGWKVRAARDKQRIVREFLDTHDAWVIDGNYSGLYFDRRMEEADLIVLLLFGRLACLARVLLRYRKYRDRTRPDMAEGCREKVDPEFVSWVLWRGRSGKARDRYRQVRQRYAGKVLVLKDQRQLDRLIGSLS